MTSKPTLTRIDWIKAAFRALDKGGPKAIRAEAIARDLKVSKGSFYWHFSNVADLCTSMIEHWQQDATASIIHRVEHENDGNPEKLRALFTMIAGNLADPYGGVGIEAAIRDWARYDPEVRKAIHTVDQQRIAFVQALLLNVGQTDAMAARNTRILYAALLGFQQLAYLHPDTPMDDLPDLLEMVLQSPTD